MRYSIQELPSSHINKIIHQNLVGKPKISSFCRRITPFLLANKPTKSTYPTETMRWDELEPDFMQEQESQQQEQQDSSYLDFDTLSLISKPKDYYRILEVDYEATEEEIRSNYIRLALKWHPDKKKGEDSATSKFQEINEAYQVLSDPVRKEEYDKKGMLYLYDYNIVDYLNRYKGLILTCNGLGMKTSML